MRAMVAALGTAVLAGCSLFGIRGGYEQPPYEVVERVEGGVEVRLYGPRLAAETTVVAANAEDGRSAAFRILAGYIFGANRPKSKIAMTAPVEVQEGAQTIAMTAPVQAADAGEGRYSMRFFLPGHLRLETAPEPADPRVRLLEVPEETLAVLRYTGSRSAEATAAKRGKLLDVLKASQWQPTAEPVDLFYDPPWTVPFLRRNEASVPVGLRR